MADNGVHTTEEDPAAAFLAQQENEIAVIENDDDGFGALEGTDGEQPPQEPLYDGFGEEPAIVNGDMFPESNGPTDSYAAIAQVDQLRQEPESLRKWREEQKDRLEELDSASKTAEAEWKEKAKKELEEWHVHQNEQMEKNKANNRLCPSLARASEEALMAESDGGDTGALGTEWERVARLCDFNPKTNKQAKDVSRMRSVLISLKQTPLVR
ncbi:clathrin light chain B isoform X2 [Gadus macrocephalus]|uniref:clathrin light chain B isoform X1 n=1 Tax=Gadus chalcogrammus TaxID=1042646 RepID=UPI0024C49467|nr:clathrin light chain B isoform X1 [Gadus chalcogrammus]XP_059918795.1 clathrin light chain B isoform X2 [Gadus macrocephalus]